MLAWSKWGYPWLWCANSGPGQSLTEPALPLCPLQVLKQAERYTSKPPASTPAPHIPPASHTCKITTRNHGLLNHPHTKPISYAYLLGGHLWLSHLSVTFPQGQNGTETSFRSSHSKMYPVALERKFGLLQSKPCSQKNATLPVLYVGFLFCWLF